MDQLLIALDVDTGNRALALADRLRGHVGGFKVGSRLFTAEGPPIVTALAGRGDRVFLDLKFHDIPTTVAGAVAAAARLDVWMLTVHASGGSEMLRAARDAADTAARAGGARPKIVAVTVLTSLTAETLRALGISRPLPDQVAALAREAHRAGLDGIVASPLEIGDVRQACGSDFTIVTPGIRPAGADRDQARTMTASDAVRAGANYLVVGRPVIAAPDPVAAAAALASEIRRSMPPPREFILYSRPGCHLCDEMKAVVDRVARRHGVPVREVDISTSEALERTYGETIPVLTFEGRKVAKYRVREEELERMLR